jgi:HEAT repeat protein
MNAPGLKIVSQVEHQSLLHQTQQLAAQADWGQVTARLQALLQGDRQFNDQPFSRLSPDDRVAWLDLAIQVLEAGDFQLRWDVGKLLPRFEREAMTALLELLSDDATHPDVHWFAVRALADFPDPAIIPTLLQTIQTTDAPELHQAAAQVLAQMGAPVMPSLAVLLESPSSRAIAVQILAQMRHPTVVPMLLGVVADPDPVIRATAIEALSGYHSPTIAQVLLQALGDPDNAVRLTAVRSVGFCFNDLPDPDWLGRIQPLLHDADRAISRQTALTLGRLGSLGAIKALAAVLRSPQTPEPLAIDAIRSLCWMEQQAAILELGQLWSDMSPTLRQILCEHLGRIETSVLQTMAVDHLMRWFSTDPLVGQWPDVSLAIVTALGSLGDPRAIAILTQSLPTAEPRLRLHLVAALKQINPTDDLISPCA